jgi:hypothetical protein
MPPPARLVSRLQPSGPVVDFKTLPEPQVSYVESMLRRFFSWKCSICLEGQPLSDPPSEFVEYARSACLLGDYRAACRDAEQPANNPPVLPPVPIISALCLASKLFTAC